MRKNQHKCCKNHKNWMQLVHKIYQKIQNGPKMSKKKDHLSEPIETFFNRFLISKKINHPNYKPSWTPTSIVWYGSEIIVGRPQVGRRRLLLPEGASRMRHRVRALRWSLTTILAPIYSTYTPLNCGTQNPMPSKPLGVMCHFFQVFFFGFCVKDYVWCQS